jgi:hypothetical protein
MTIPPPERIYFIGLSGKALGGLEEPNPERYLGLSVVEMV